MNTIFLCVLILAATCLSQQFHDLVKNTSMGRIEIAWYNHDKSDYFIGDLFDYQIVVNPNPRPKDSTGSVNLCDEKLWESVILPLNISSPNICQEYFCGTSTPYYQREGSPAKTNSLSNHIHMHRMCLQCNVTQNQEFQTILNDPKISCPGFNRHLCQNTTCVGNSTCIFYNERTSFCYMWEDGIYYGKNDYNHRVLYWIIYSTLEYLNVGLYPVLLIFYIVLVLIPEIAYLISTFKPEEGGKCGQLIMHFFGLKSQSIYLVGLGIVIFSITKILDVFQFSNLKFAYFGMCLTLGVTFMAFINISVKWTQIIRHTDYGTDIMISKWEIFFIIVFYIISLVYGLLGIFLYLAHVFILSSERGFFSYSLGVYMIIGILIIGILVSALVIGSLRILHRISLNKEEMSSNLLKRNFSRIVLTISISLIPIVLIMVILAVMQLVGRDAFSLPFWLFFVHVATWLFLLYDIGLIFAFMRIESLQIAYCCCLRKKPSH